ncbi:hypothetical protein DY000_02040824 [Brassica cretica]|uniref:Replication factor A C-terminal domain-containing protein n=1 Tax=Brassica cretica TaxID=69181 RepID=A0ABQ7BLH5_BRACR|nr:hypothetical protein DY000_02040824 [Brassica cretica]
MKSNGNSHVSTGKSPVAFNFKVIPEGSSESELQFRLIHFSEARNAAKGGSLIGLELLLIEDEQIRLPIDEDRIDFCKIVNSYSSWPFELYVSATVLDYTEIRIVCSSSMIIPTKTGTLALSSVSSSRVFMDYDIQPTIDYLNWLVFILGSTPEIAYLVNEEVLTKAETMTIREIFAYIKQESAKALFACMATTDYVLRNSSRYIACSDCKTKATRGPSLMYPKCGNVNVTSFAQYEI